MLYIWSTVNLRELNAVAAMQNSDVGGAAVGSTTLSGGVCMVARVHFHC